MASFAEDAKAWRDERDKSDPLPTNEPLLDFDAAVEAYVRKHPPDRTLGGRLPDKWWEMTEDQLGQWMDGWLERERRVAAATASAIHYAIKTGGMAGLDRRRDDIARMSYPQLEELITALIKGGAPQVVIDTLAELAK